MTNKHEIILQLNKSGLNILEIFIPYNRQDTLVYYATDEFIPVQSNIFENTVTGIDITRIIEEDSLQIQTSSNNKEHKILTKMAEMETCKKKFSKDYSYIWHLCK